MKVLVIVMHYIVNGRFEDLNQINHRFLDNSLQKCIYPLSMKNVLSITVSATSNLMDKNETCFIQWNFPL